MFIAHNICINYKLCLNNIQTGKANIELTKNPGLSQRIRNRAESQMQKHFKHPFLLSWQNGSLEVEKSRFYIAQDYLYLKDYIRVMAFALTRTKTHNELAQFTKYLNKAIKFTKSFAEMHKMTFEELFQTEYAPTNYAYTRHYLSIGATETLPKIVTLMLPCLWLYDEIDKKMNIDFGPYIKGKNLKNIVRNTTTSISGEKSSLTFLREYLDNYGQHILPDEEKELQKIFDVGLRYEYKFWDMSWNLEKWID